MYSTIEFSTSTMVFSKRYISFTVMLPDVHRGCADAPCWGGLVLFSEEQCCLLQWELMPFAVKWCCLARSGAKMVFSKRNVVLTMVFSKRNVLLADMSHPVCWGVMLWSGAVFGGQLYSTSYLQMYYLLFTEAVLILLAWERWCCLPRSDAVCWERCCFLRSVQVCRHAT